MFIKSNDIQIDKYKLNCNTYDVVYLEPHNLKCFTELCGSDDVTLDFVQFVCLYIIFYL